MAKKPAAKDITIQELPPAMDYAQHNGTYEGFMQMLKWSIAALALVVLALYAFIEAGQPLIGSLLLALIPVGGIGVAVMGTRRT
jgi:hypothetical protein